MSRADEEAQMEASAAPLMDHLIELRRRLIWCIAGFMVGFLLSFAFATSIFNALVVPFQWAVEWHGMTSDDVQFIYTAPQEFFFTQIKIGAFGGLLLAFPLIATQLYLFIAPGLYSNERTAFVPFLLATPILFLVGAALVYFFIIPMAMWFFLSLEQTGGEGLAAIQHLPRVSEYLALIMTLIFAFGLVFQLPVALTLMSRAGLVTPDGLASKRKYAIVIAFICAAILTPPDPVTQLGLAIPTILLYELSIYMARRFEPEASDSDEDDEAEADGSADDEAEPAAKA